MRSFLVFSYILKGKIGGPSAFNSLQGSRIFAGKNRSYIIDTLRKLTWSLEREILLRKSSVLGSRSTRIFWCHGWHHYLCWESWRKKGWTKVSNHWFSWNILWVEDQCDRAQETLKKGWRQAEEHQLIPLKWWNRWISPTWTQLNLLNHCIPSCHSNPPLFKWYPSVVEHCLWTFPGQPCMNPPSTVEGEAPGVDEGWGFTGYPPWFSSSSRVTFTSKSLGGWGSSPTNIWPLKLY